MPKREPTLSRAAFERLVREHHAAVYRTCLRIVRDEATALDVTQQVYVALLEGRIALSGDGDERVLRWFAVRASLQELRGSSSRRAHEEKVAMQHEPDGGGDPVADRDAARFVERLVTALPEELRLAVRLRYDEGLTYAAIGEALSISEPSAHERVKRALERLRERLSGAGLAALGTGLEDQLASSAQAPAPLLPAHVAHQLVALHSGAAAAAVLPTGGIGLAIAGAAAAVVLWIAFAGAHDRTDVVTEFGAATVLDERAASNADDRTQAGAPHADTTGSARTSLGSAVAPQPAPREDMREGTLRGRLVDDQDRPVRDVVLEATSIERDGKSARHAGRGRSNPDGTFTIALSAAVEGGTHYEIELADHIAPEGFDGLENRGKASFVLVEAGREVDAGTLRLRPGPRDEPGNFTVVLHIVDDRGGPVVGATAILSRNVRSPEGWSPRTWEAGGPTDAGGIVRLVGEHVGSKQLVVDARSQGFRRLARDLSVTIGARDETIVLERGLEIEGTLRDLDGHAVTTGTNPANNGLDIQVYARGASSPNEWVFAAIDARGAFLLRGLDDEDYQLDVQGGPWSRVCLTGVRAGTRDLALRLKLDDDARDVGDHCAEIHARLVDAVTRQPVQAGAEAVEVVELPAGTTRAAFEESMAPSFQWRRPVQTMWMGDVPATSDRVRRTGLEGGTYAFIVRVPGYATGMAAPIELAPHALRNDIEIRLVRPAALTGRVLDVDGKPMAGAFVMLGGTSAPADEVLGFADQDVRNTDGKPQRAVYGLFATDAEGRFRIEGVAPDLSYSISALHAHREPVRSAPVGASAGQEVELRFTRAR